MVLMALLLFSCGCHGCATRESMDEVDIPDGLYEIYVHDLVSTIYAVVLDIPDDEIRVFMRHTDRTERMGMGQPGPYVAEFQRRVRGFGSTIRIMDRDGTLRGYLMVSHSLSYMVQRSQNAIMVSVWDARHEDLFGPKLGPARKRKRFGVYHGW